MLTRGAKERCVRVRGNKLWRARRMQIGRELWWVDVSLQAMQGHF